MKQRSASCAILLVFLSLAFLRPAMAEPIRIITFEYAPFMYGDGVGLLEKIFHEVARETGEPIEFQIYPRKRALMMFALPETGEMFLGEREYFPAMADSLEFLKILEIKTVFVYLKHRYTTLPYSDFRDLKGKRVGISIGSVYAPVFTAAGILVDPAKLENNLLKLNSERIDFWHTVDFAATTLIRKHDPIKENDYGFLPDQIHTVELMVKKGTPAEKDFISLVHGFETIVANGTVQAILDQGE